MFRISHVLGTHREHDRRCIAEVQALLVTAFPDLADVPDYVARKLAEQTTRVYPTVLLAAHGPGDKVMGFALADHFEWIGHAYLDFIVTQADQRGRGLGGALYEEFRYSEAGQPQSATFLDYLCPTAAETGFELVSDHLESPSPLTPLGAKGCGEGSSMSFPVAFANAVAPAGVAIHSLPLHGEALFQRMCTDVVAPATKSVHMPDEGGHP